MSGFPIRQLDRVEPIYQQYPGWTEDISSVRSLSDLPANALSFIQEMSRIVGCPIDIVSVGPDREQTIVAQDPFDA